MNSKHILIIFGVIIPIILYFLVGFYWIDGLIGGDNWFIDYINNDWSFIGGL